MKTPSSPAARSADGPIVACSICLAEIPHSVAKSHEGAEYVYYFCGDVCFAQWEAEADAEGLKPDTKKISTA